MKKSALALIISALSTSAIAQNVVVFGDSLSDIGQTNWAHKAAYYQNGVASPLYNEIVAERLGSKLTASSSGGTNYAYSAGVAVARNSESTAVQPNVVVQKQIENYLSKGANPADLHIVWVGGNDMAAILQRALSGSNPTGDVIDGANESAAASAKQWATLRQAGVQTAVFPTVPNVVYTPSLFQLVGQSVANELAEQAKPFGETAQTQIKTGFQNAFNLYSAQLNASTQTSTADFEQARLDVLKKSVAALYQSPQGAALSAVADQATLTQMLISKYQTAAAQATKATELFNQYTSAALNKVGGNIVRLDTDALFQEMLANPAAFGLTNTTGTACENVTRTHCTPSNPKADEMLFADGFHPNSIAHKVMADYITTTLNSPKEMAVLARLAEHNSEIALDLAREQSNQNRLQRQAESSVSAFAQHQRQNNGNGSFVGLKAQFTPQWQFSATLGQQKQQAKLGGTTAENKTKSINATIRYDANNWWLGSGVQIASHDFQSQRRVQLGLAQQTQNAQTNGATLTASLFGGYEWTFEKNVISALGDVSYNSSKIATFGETRQGATRLEFDEQRNNSVKTGLGIAYRYQGEQFQPFVSARWVKNWSKQNNNLGVKLNGNRFEVALPKADRSWVNLQAGVNYQLAAIPLNFTAYISQDVARKQKIGGTSFNLGLGYKF